MPSSPRFPRISGAGPALWLLLVLEAAVFSRTGTNFAGRENAFEVLKFSVEIGLLAAVMTPVILTGGIDLSVGSLLGLCAVCFGQLWRDARLAWEVAAVLTLAIGGLAGGLNALLVTRLRIPPLMATLGTFSLFRGAAEALTRGVDNFTGFPASFLAHGQGYYAGILPAQVPVFLAVAAFLWVLAHQTTLGRSWRAIGFSPEGARHAGLPVERQVALAYLLSGVVAALAALLYVARVGQAKADAGTGYELLAITAVVLGGTSIFGGRGSVPGTLLGVVVLAVLKNGLQLSDQPAELAGILTGVLLILALTAEAAGRWGRRRRATPA
ncbi:MAG: ABC transporter permease [Verrucomicrobiota bacterium]